MYSKIKNYSKLKKPINKNLASKSNFIEFLINSRNDLQFIVEKNYKILGKLLLNMNKFRGCHFSRMTGSGSVCYGLFDHKIIAKKALNKLKKKYPKFWISLAKTV